MPSQLTVTASTGPAVVNTAAVIANVVRVDFDLAQRVVHVTKSGSPTVIDYDLGAVATTTFSWSGASATMVIA